MLDQLNCPRCGYMNPVGIAKNLSRARRRISALVLITVGTALAILFFVRASQHSVTELTAHKVGADHGQGALALVVAVAGVLLLKQRRSEWRCPSCGSEN